MRGLWFGVLFAVLSPAAGLSGQALDDPLVRVMGFGDFNYLLTELDRQEGFRIGQMVGHVIADLDERFTFFSEVSVTGRDNGYSIEVERALDPPTRRSFSPDWFRVTRRPCMLYVSERPATTS